MGLIGYGCLEVGLSEVTEFFNPDSSESTLKSIMLESESRRVFVRRSSWP